LAVLAAALNADALGAPAVPGFRIFSLEPSLMRLRFACMFAYRPLFAIFLRLLCYVQCDRHSLFAWLARFNLGLDVLRDRLLGMTFLQRHQAFALQRPIAEQSLGVGQPRHGLKPFFAAIFVPVFLPAFLYIAMINSLTVPLFA
jgi:hypothetical protein